MDAAKREGALTLSWTAATLGPQDQFQKYIDGYNRMYGFSLNVTYTPGPSMPQMAGQAVQAAQANKPAISDVVLGEALHITTMSNGKALTIPNWTSWAPAIQDRSIVSPDGGAVEFELVFPGITYNTNSLKGDAIPKTLQDLLKPQYKGRIASTVYAAHFDELSTNELWGQPKTKEFVDQFAKQIMGLIQCGDIGRIASGEFDALALDCGTSFQQWQAQHAPIGHVIPADAAFSDPLYMAVPKTAPHPNAAELFINYMLSRQGQDVLYEEVGSDNPTIPGSHTEGDWQRVKAASAKPVYADVQFWERNDEKSTAAFKAQLLKTLQQK